MNGLSVCRKFQIARAYAAFFVAASFFIEGTTAVQNAHIARQTLNSPGPVSFFSFSTVPNATTCAPFTFNWSYTGTNAVVSFYATNDDVAQEPSPTSTSTTSTSHFTGTDDHKVARAVPTGASNPTQILTILVENDASPFDMGYTWPSVDIPQGWYQLIASLSSPASPVPRNTSSPSFFVFNGPDTSCLSSSSPTNTATTQTASQSTSTGASTSSTASTSLPVGGASTSKTHAGLIAGVTIGALVLAAAALAAWLWFSKTKQRTKAGASSSQHVPRRWNGLGSTDSRGGFMGDAPSHRHRFGDSMGTIPMSPSDEAVSGAEKHSIHSKFGEGSPFDDGPGLALATLPVLQQRQPSTTGIPRRHSISSSLTNGLSPNEFGGFVPPDRRPSVPESITGRQSIDSMGYPPSSPSSPSSGGLGGRNSALFIPAPGLSRSHSLSTSATHQTSMMGGHTGFMPGGSAQSTSSHAGLLYQTQPSRYTPSPQPEANSPISLASSSVDAALKQANRRSSGGTKRKPVPVYNTADEPDVPSTPSVPSLSSTPIPPPSPVPDYVPHYLTRSQAGQDRSQPELVHKSSFGPAGIEGKPLHYLMPDMPMPLRD